MSHKYLHQPTGFRNRRRPQTITYGTGKHWRRDWLHWKSLPDLKFMRSNAEHTASEVNTPGGHVFATASQCGSQMNATVKLQVYAPFLVSNAWGEAVDEHKPIEYLAEPLLKFEIFDADTMLDLEETLHAAADALRELREGLL